MGHADDVDRLSNALEYVMTPWMDVDEIIRDNRLVARKSFNCC